MSSAFGIQKLKLPSGVCDYALPASACPAGRAYFTKNWGVCAPITRTTLRQIIDAGDEGCSYLVWYLSRAAFTYSDSSIGLRASFYAALKRYHGETWDVCCAMRRECVNYLPLNLAADVKVWDLAVYITREKLTEIVEDHIDLPD